MHVTRFCRKDVAIGMLDDDPSHKLGGLMIHRSPRNHGPIANAGVKEVFGAQGEKNVPILYLPTAPKIVLFRPMKVEPDKWIITRRPT